MKYKTFFVTFPDSCVVNVNGFNIAFGAWHYINLNILIRS